MSRQRRQINSAMARVMAHYLLSGFYIVAFFAIMSAVALGANWIVMASDQRISIRSFCSS